MDINEQMNRFRLASRNVYNQFFRPSSCNEEAFPFEMYERYEEVEQALFSALIIKPFKLPPACYAADAIEEIGVCVSSSGSIPVMINRDKELGNWTRPINYWDHPIKEISAETKMRFISYFDFDGTRTMDNQYVLVAIVAAPPNTGIVGRRALIETQYIEFVIES